MNLMLQVSILLKDSFLASFSSRDQSFMKVCLLLSCIIIFNPVSMQHSCKLRSNLKSTFWISCILFSQSCLSAYSEWSYYYIIREPNLQLCSYSWTRNSFRYYPTLICQITSTDISKHLKRTPICKTKMN